MSVIRIGGFQGELPRIHPRLLPSSSAQTALNCRIETRCAGLDRRHGESAVDDVNVADLAAPVLSVYLAGSDRRTSTGYLTRLPTISMGA